SVLFGLDDTLFWDEKSIGKEFEATCVIEDNRYKIDTKELEKNVRIYEKEIYHQYETYEFVSNIGKGKFEYIWGDFTDKGNEIEKLQSIQADYRKTSWENGLKALNINDEELAVELAEVFPKERRKHIYLYEETLTVLDELKKKHKLLM